MPVIQVPTTIQPRQIEFGEGVERSKSGALYFTPGAVKKITDDEYEWLKKHHKRFANLLVILPIINKKSRLELKEEKNNPKIVLRKPKPKEVVSQSKQKAKMILENAKNKKITTPIEKKIENKVPIFSQDSMIDFENNELEDKKKKKK